MHIARRPLRPRTVHTAPYRLLVDRLRVARQEAGLTQREVAARLGKPASYPAKVELAERELNAIELRTYLSALGVTFLQFMAELDSALSELEHEGR